MGNTKQAKITKCKILARNRIRITNPLFMKRTRYQLQDMIPIERLNVDRIYLTVFYLYLPIARGTKHSDTFTAWYRLILIAQQPTFNRSMGIRSRGATDSASAKQAAG